MNLDTNPEKKQNDREHKEHKEHKEHQVRDESPRFGVLLIVLLIAVALIVALTFATEAFYTH